MKRVGRKIFIAFTILAALVFILACFTPYINPASFWPITFLALAFPIIAVCFFAIVLSWLFLNWKISLALLLLLLGVGFTNLHATFATNAPSTFKFQKDTNSLRILSWNVGGFALNSYASDSSSSIRRRMINFIKKANPDIMLFQEFADWNYPGTYSNVKTFRDSLNYKYCYTTKDSVLNLALGTVHQGVAIFSKMPLTDSGKVAYTQGWESLGHADGIFQNKPFRIFTTHLASTAIHPTKEYKGGKTEYRNMWAYFMSVWNRLKYYDQFHSRQALQVRQQMDNSKIPFIFSGDLNSVPSSFSYHTIKGNSIDAFIERGWKLGHTYNALSKTLRIDYVFVHPAFKVMQVTSPGLLLSDHFPVITDIQWKDQDKR